MAPHYSFNLLLSYPRGNLCHCVKRDTSVFFSANYLLYHSPVFKNWIDILVIEFKGILYI